MSYTIPEIIELKRISNILPIFDFKLKHNTNIVMENNNVTLLFKIVHLINC